MTPITRLSLIAALLAGAGMFSTSAMAATATGTASATVLTPIAITAGSALNFGSFAAVTGGTVVMTQGGTRTTTGTVFATTTGGNGTFAVTGSGSMTFGVTTSGPFNVVHTVTPANTMPVTLDAPTGGTLSIGAATVPVGGTLTVASGQLAGTYTGSYTMTVEYN